MYARNVTSIFARLFTPLLAVAIAILLSACGSSDDGSPELRPIDEILVAPIEITDLGANSAVMRAETTIDVVCSVVYGPDEDYGSQATDQDMAGGGHSDHAPMLRGLEPDTEYHYRLQGTAADGTLYVSEDMTFRTPATSSSEQAPGPNLAAATAGATIVEASSTFDDSETWAPENAIDEDPATEWSSAGDEDEAFITVQLAESSEVKAVGLWTRTMGASAQISSFRVVTDTGQELGPFDLPGSGSLHVFPVEAEASQLRFEVVESSGGNTGAVEVAAYGDAP